MFGSLDFEVFGLVFRALGFGFKFSGLGGIKEVQCIIVRAVGCRALGHGA